MLGTWTDDDVPTTELAAKRLFVLLRVREAIQIATAAGHGYAEVSWPEHERYGRDVWTKLREDNLRLVYDYQFLQVNNPGAVIADLYRKADLARIGNERLVSVLAQQWADHPDFPDRWRTEPPTSRDRADALDDAIEQARLAAGHGRDQTEFPAGAGHEG